MLGSAMVGALSGTPDSMTRTCAPDADNSAARTEPAAPAPTTMKSYRVSSFESLVILNSQDLKSDFFGRPRRLNSRELRPSTSDLAADHQTFIPPSTTISTPVTYELSSDARNKATFATSSGRPSRPSSVLLSIALAHSGSFNCSRV